MLRSLFEWLDAHPTTYWLILAGPTLALAGWIINELREDPKTGPAHRREWLSALLLLFFLLAWRWPYLLAAEEYNPDESQFIAGAMTLMHDPVFWRSVDGTTSGPLNFYVLLPLHLIGLPLDYFSARLTGVLLAWLTLLLGCRFFRDITTRGAALLAMLPFAVFFAASDEINFVHYSSETVALLLLMAAICGLAWPPRSIGRVRWLAGAFGAGLLPWAKLQTAPLGAMLILWTLVQIGWARDHRSAKTRNLLQLLGAAAAPSFLILGAVLLTGQWEPFYRSYFLQNVVYVGLSQPFSQVLEQLAGFAFATSHFGWWLAGIVTALLGGAIGYVVQHRRPGRLLGLALLLTVTAAFCVFAPGRPSLHYLWLLVLPLTLGVGAVIVDLGPLFGTTRINRAVSIIFLLSATLLLPLGWRLTQPVPAMFGQFADHWRQPRSGLANIIRHYANGDADSLAVWGWRNSAYVECDLRQATRDALSAWAILPSGQRDYYQARYLTDLERNRPAVFLDAVGPGSPFMDDRRTQAHEIFPALADYVSRHYRLVIDLQSARVYARNDVFDARHLSILNLQKLLAAGRPEIGTDAPFDSVTPANAPRNTVDGRIVQMIEPPVALTWNLHGTERELQFQYGVHPKAYTEGRTNGAEFIVELHPAGRPAVTIFRRLLDPVAQPVDRGTQRSRLALPPFLPGSSLVMRATNGDFGDGGWDWVYVGRVRFVHSPFYSPAQFPGFGRVPDTAMADGAYLLDEPSRRLLMLPPPTELGFNLHGSESVVSFTYGFQNGAYTAGGGTDGAIFSLEIQRRGGAPEAVFRRHLDPRTNATDRGPQQTTLKLPRPAAGDRLLLRIQAGGNAAWDWTYVSDFALN